MPSPEPTKLSAQWLARNVGRTAGTETGYFFLACAFRVIDVVILGWQWYFSEVLILVSDSHAAVDRHIPPVFDTQYLTFYIAL